MRIKFIKDDDFINYKKCSLFIGTISCTWKCCKEQNLPCSICQNYPWSDNLIKDIPNQQLIQRFINDPLTQAIVFGGLEPLDQFTELLQFIKELRQVSWADVVIYTGYKENEVADKITALKPYGPIIVKFGRYVPNEESHFDEVLGIKLASSNQYAKQIS